MELTWSQLLSSALNSPYFDSKDPERVLELTAELSTLRRSGNHATSVAELPADVHKIYTAAMADVKMRQILLEFKEWDEDAHPRGADGKFGEGGGETYSPKDRPPNWTAGVNRSDARYQLRNTFMDTAFYGLGGADTGTLNSIGRALTKVGQRYGFHPSIMNIDKHGDWIKDPERVYACVPLNSGSETDDRMILLSPHWYGKANYSGLNKQCKSDESTGWHVNKSGNPESIVIHEMGHVAYNEMVQRYVSADKEGDRSAESFQGKMSTWFGTYTADAHGASISQYAKTNSYEIWAETFAWLHTDHEGAMKNPAGRDMDAILQTYGKWKESK